MTAGRSAIDGRSERGFTLIEALVALAIGGVVIATLATITGQWLRSWNAGSATLQRAELLSASLDRIVADLSAARPMPASSSAPGLIFSGEATSVTFVRRSLPVEVPAGLEIVRLAPLAGDSDVTLARSRSALPFGAVATAPSDPSPLVLMRAPYALRFSYADTDQLWQTRWRAPDRMPRLIRVEVVDRRTGRGILAPIVAAVHVDAPASCAAVPSAKLCNGAIGSAGQDTSPSLSREAPGEL